MEIGVDPDDFKPVKSVLTVLGYLSKSTIATLKTKKKVNDLEVDYMKLRSNINKFNALCVRFPELKEIDTSPSGLVANIKDIAGRLSQSEINVEFDDEQSILQKLLAQGKKVWLLFSMFC